MQRGNLVQNLTSNYLQAANAKRSRALPPDVQVYVEGHEDIAFWRTVFQEYEQQGIVRFRITQPSTTGKMEVLSLQDQAGAYLLLCVDSDFDYLLNGKTASSATIRNNPYIFHTYAYSIENYQCFAQSLHQVCVQATLNDAVDVDFVAVLEAYSAIIVELLPWIIHFQETDNADKFSLSDCNKVIGFQENPDVEQQCAEALNDVKNRVNAELTRLRTAFPNETNKVEALQEEMKTQDYSSKTAYLFMQGHTLKANVVLMILKRVCQQLESSKIASLRENVSTEEGNRRMNEYVNRRKKVNDVLDMNTEYRSCFLYARIQHDVEQYIQGLP